MSVLEVKDGRFETRCIDGDSDLGGRDLDEKLFDYCAEEIKKRWQKDCKSDRFTKQELMEMCEELKIALSTRKEERFNFIFYLNNYTTSYVVLILSFD